MSLHGKLINKIKNSHNTKFVFVSGGVLSGLGKGITAASLGLLLKNRGYSVTNIKCENYLNIDSGNINPVEHGDVFLCEDGLEADLDLGSYERFLGEQVGHKNFATLGQIYSTVIENTKNLAYGGATVDAWLYIPQEAMRRIRAAGQGYDICLVELGGTAGEYQNVIYYEAYRIMKLQNPEDTLHIHVTYFPNPSHINELKSKPTQLSVTTLNSMGIQPDFIVGRGELPIDDKRKEKVAFFCNMSKEDVISNPDCDSVYEVPPILAEQDFDGKVLRKLHLPERKQDLTEWNDFIKKLKSDKKHSVKIAIIAKYLSTGDYELTDSYVSLIESLKFAALHTDANMELLFVKATDVEKKEKNALKMMQSADGIIVPIGWGERGVEGKITAITYARENKIPYLGLCYGMQLASVEFARNVVGLKGAHTVEVNPETPYPIIHDIPFEEKYQTIKGQGASMRLGAYDCILKPGTLAHKIYKKHHAFKDERKNLISERHRHRYEFNNEYRKPLEDAGFVISGTSPDDFFVEMIELPQDKHPFFLATQAHPEYKSMPLNPHPIFVEYLHAVIDQSEK
ncbi:MAG: CTP synthetase [Patescibacteria group bacterium]|nr:MAG: CTP synthetase [Patescibacteria group bacterium]